MRSGYKMKQSPYRNNEFASLSVDAASNVITIDDQ